MVQRLRKVNLKSNPIQSVQSLSERISTSGEARRHGVESFFTVTATSRNFDDTFASEVVRRRGKIASQKLQGIRRIEGSCSCSFHCNCYLCRCASPVPASADASPAPTTRAQAKKAEAANKPPAAAAADPAGTESDDLEQRDAGRASSACSLKGRGRGAGSQIKAKVVRLEQHQISLVAAGTTGQLDVPFEDPMDRPAKKLKHASKDGKVFSIAMGLCVIVSSTRSF